MRSLSIVTILLLSACSTATVGMDRSIHLLSDRPAPRSGCRVVFQPHPLPSLSQLADSAALLSAVADYAARHPLSEGSIRALYSMAFGSMYLTKTPQGCVKPVQA